jgi:hypothetical protein
LAVQELVARGFAEVGIADHHRHDMARRRHYRQAGLGEAAFQPGGALLMAVALGLPRLQMAYRGECAGGQRRRQ